MGTNEKYIIVEREHYYNLLEKRGLMKRTSIIIGSNNPECDPGEIIILEKE